MGGACLRSRSVRCTWASDPTKLHSSISAATQVCARVCADLRKFGAQDVMDVAFLYELLGFMECVSEIPRAIFMFQNPFSYFFQDRIMHFAEKNYSERYSIW